MTRGHPPLGLDAPEDAPRAAVSRRTLLGRGAAGLLGLTTVGLAVRAVRWSLPSSPAERLAARLGLGLLALQDEAGVFDPHPGDVTVPVVSRTGPHALAAYALAALLRSPARTQLEGLEAARDRALEVLVSRQQPGGMFGGVRPSRKNPWPAVDTVSQAVLALAAGGRPEDLGPLIASTASLARTAEYGFREGWTRALGVLALGAAWEAGALQEAGGDLARLVVVSPRVDAVDLQDQTLAEGLAQQVRGDGEAVRARILGAALERPPLWQGGPSPVTSWWLLARLLGGMVGSEPYFEALHKSIEAGVEDPPEGILDQGWYADRVTRTAAAILALLEAPSGHGSD